MKYNIKATKHFEKWLSNIKDKQTLTRIDIRINRVSKGNFGDYKIISENLFELRLFFGSGYRIYYTIIENQIVLLLSAGDKNSQTNDIKKAKELQNKLQG
jgi:putative addiction module killer protein